MANPYEKYAKPKENPYQKYAQEKTLVDDVMQGPVGQVGLGAMEGLATLPGLPVEAIVGGGNFLRRQMGLPETQLQDTVAKDWGAQGWYDFAKRNLDLPEGPAPQGEVERIARKGGQFVGGALPLGPAGMVPALTATAGSEVGRATDQAGLTGGYGETLGAIAGGAAPGLVRGQTTAGLGNAPSIKQLKAAGSKAYKAADDAGVIIESHSLNRLAQDVRADLARLKYRERLQPKVGPVLDELDAEIRTGNTTLSSVDGLRQVANNAIAGTLDKAERKMLGSIVSRIDDYIDTLQPGEVIAGDSQAATAALKQGRDYWKRMRKAEIVETMIKKAERQANKGGVGGNVDNAYRQRISQILDNEKKANLFNEPERAMMQRVVDGTASHNILRGIGKLSPGTSGLTSWFGIGSTFVHPAGVALPVAGAIAKPIADSLTRRNAARVSEFVRMGGKQGQLTPRQRANALMLELRRRAKLAGQSTAAAIPGAVNQ